MPQQSRALNFKEVDETICRLKDVLQLNLFLLDIRYSIMDWEKILGISILICTKIVGLFLTGQDILSCGFTGALFAGVISAQV